MDVLLMFDSQNPVTGTVTVKFDDIPGPFQHLLQLPAQDACRDIGVHLLQLFRSNPIRSLEQKAVEHIGKPFIVSEKLPQPHISGALWKFGSPSPP